MTVKLNQIEGLMLKKVDYRFDGSSTYGDGIKEGIKLMRVRQGERSITLNREKLAIICHKNSGYGRGFGRKFDLMCASDQEVFYNEADAIISQLPTLLEAVK